MHIRTAAALSEHVGCTATVTACTSNVYPHAKSDSTKEAGMEASQSSAHVTKDAQPDDKIVPDVTVPSKDT